MSRKMPPVPPANRSSKGLGNSDKVDTRSDAAVAENRFVKQSVKRHNTAEEGDMANVKQNTTNKGYFRGRRMG